MFLLLPFFCHPSRSKVDGKTFYFTARAWLNRVLPSRLLASWMITAIATKTCLLTDGILKHSSFWYWG
ncbi:hypothetical protein H6G17_30435 [Chroococcidiopsis sp. FACHB-1243]|nr:hypothetical protein [Chroococcidiopsis sp. [FACHB-1243]]